MRAQIAERKAEILAFLRRRSSTSEIAVPPIRSRAHGEAAPLSFAQERLWFLEQLEPESTAYNICRASRLLGNLSSPLLEASLKEIISRHEALRTAFRLIDGKPVQVVRPAERISIDFVDLRSVPESERNSQIQRQIEAEALRPFNLESGLLLRCALLRVGEQEHILVLTTHHSAADAWSMGTLTRELWTLYDAFSNGMPCPLEPLPVQYSDYAVWQREWLQGDVLESQLGYWKERLKDLSVLNLPTDRPRQPRQSFRGARVTIEFPDELTSAVNEMSHRFAVTPFMILLAAFQVLLYRYTGQEDVMVGSPIANRRRPEVEGLIGFFVNTLVLRTDLSGKPSFTELLFRVRDLCVGADANQDLPFEKLVQELQPERDQSRNPLFQVMFVLQNATHPFTGIPGLRIEPLEVDMTRSPFDLSLFLRERDGKYIGHIEYSTDLFDHDRIERMAGHFRTLLEAIVKAPDQPIATLPILTEAKRHRILVEWNDTAADYPKDKCIHQLFEEQVERTPEAIAVEFEDQQITYRELSRRANQLAHYLISLGIGPEKLVGICAERSIEMVIGLLGILKAGGAYVPLDPQYPEERLKFMVEDAQCSVLLTQKVLVEDKRLIIEDDDRPSILDPQRKMVCLDRDWPMIAEQTEDDPQSGACAENLAYVIYTSGSTGQPKGVLIPHRAVCNHVYWAQSAFRLDFNDRVLQKTSLSFDASVWEIFAPLTNGACLVLALPGGERDPSYLVRTVAEQKISMIKVVPSLVRMLLEEQMEHCTSLRHVLCGGEPLTAELRRCFCDRASATLHNLYGPTEATVDVTCWTCEGEQLETSSPIGRPIANTKTYVLDRFLQPVPVGVPGELHIGGSSLARGYLNLSELTAEKFIPNPFVEDPRARLYKTGDIVRYLKDGNLEILGRADNQLKMRGYRIEPGEIENVLNQHPSVKESVVVAQTRDSSAERELVANVVAAQEPAPPAGELSRFLREKLPNFMVPTLFVFLKALPLTSNGKLDRGALPRLDGERPPLDLGFAEPAMEIEELVARVWREVLKRNKIGVNENFFELGGHSLLAVRIVAKLQKTFDQFIPLRDLFDSPTIAGLAASIKKQIQEGSCVELPAVGVVSRDNALPLSLNQEQFWMLDRILPETHLFNMPYVYHLSGGLNLSALRKALKEIVIRHEILRTVFADLRGKPVQRIHGDSDFGFEYVDLRNSGGQIPGEEAAEYILEERNTPFRLALGPLLRIRLLRMADQDYLLLITLHHIISDQWSMLLFRKELTILYNAFVQDRASPLSPPAVQFADYAVWERRLLKEGFLNPQLDFWRKQLVGGTLQMKGIGTGRLKAELSFRTLRRPVQIDGALFVALKKFSERNNCTPFMVLLTAVNILVHLQTSQESICVGILSANRERHECYSTMGHFTNPLILRADLTRAMALKDVLRRTKEVAIAALAHQQLPFEHLANIVEQEHGIERVALLRVMLIYQNSTLEFDSMAGLKLAPVNFEYITADPELTITGSQVIFKFRETSTMLTGAVTVKPDILPEFKADELVIHLLQLVRYMVEHRNDLSETIACVARQLGAV